MKAFSVKDLIVMRHLKSKNLTGIFWWENSGGKVVVGNLGGKI
jgi:hypothetical protein